MHTIPPNTECVSCGAPIEKNFCGSCGEKRPDKHRFTLMHFVHESIEGFTHLDNKFFRTLKCLFARPGALTRHFEMGRTVRFMKPVPFFIVSNILFFVLVGQSNIFAVKLEKYLQYDNYIKYGTTAAFDKKFGADAKPASVAVLFNEKMITQSKSFIILIIPLFALFCALLFFRKKPYFTLHLVFATHFFTFLLLYLILFHFLVEIPDQYIFHLPQAVFEAIAIPLNLAIIIIYAALATAHYYGIRWYWAVATGIGMGLLFLVALQAYRILLFYKILYSIA